MSGQKIVVFGGSGLLGRYVVQALARKGYQVTVAVRRPQMAGFLRTMGEVGQVTPVPCDIKNPGNVETILKGAFAAINLVGILYEADRQTFETVHVAGSCNIAHAVKKNGLQHSIHISSLLDEENPHHSKYVRTKLQAEAEILKIFPDTTVLRPSLIYGRGEKFFSLYAKLLLISPFVPLFGGGKTKFQPVYAGDVANAVLTCLQVESARGKIYELGGPEVFTFKDLILKVSHCLEKKAHFVDVPYAFADFLAVPLSLFPPPLLTQDQVKMMKSDSVCGLNEKRLSSFKDLKIDPQPLDLHLADLLRDCKTCF